MEKKPKRLLKSDSRWKVVHTLVLSIVFFAPWLFSLAFPSFFVVIDTKSYDALFSARYMLKGREPVSPYIVNVVFDNESLDLLTSEISEREMYARLIRAVSDAGARLIACDIVFAGTSSSSGDDSLEKAVRDVGKVCLPLVPFSRVTSQKSPLPTTRAALASRWMIDFGSGGSPPLADGFISSFEGLAKDASSSAHIACDPDPDGVNRYFPLFYRLADSLIPALPLVVACEYLSVGPERVKIQWGQYVILKGATFPGGRTTDIKIPINESGHVVINYVSPREKSFYTISAKDLLASRQKEDSIQRTLMDVLEGSLVFISDVSARNKDIGPDVFGDMAPYSEILLSITNSVLTQNFLTFSPSLLLPILLLAFLAFLLPAYSLTRTPLGLIVPIAAIALYFLIAVFSFSFINISLPIAIPAVCFSCFFIAEVAWTTSWNERKAMEFQENLIRANNEFLRLEKGNICGTEESHAHSTLLTSRSEHRIALPSVDHPISADEGLSHGNIGLAGKALRSPEAFEGIVTRNRAMIGIFREIEAYRSSDTPILIVGETGTGKELIAHAIHRASGRKGKHVAVNVAGINDELFNDTLFGHKRGAFTGAERDEVGFVEVAECGTLFLDEIGDLSKASQIKLLRLIENKEYYPLNSKTLMKADVRIIAATNSDIDAKVRDNSFRDDLARRLGLRIAIPPLRERSDDIELLLGHFIKYSAEKAGKEMPEYSRDLVDLLKSYHFPGNIRELESMVEEAVSKSESRELPLSVFNARMTREMRAGEMIQVSSEGLRKSFSFSGNLLNLLGEIESSYIMEAMNAAKGNRRKAAKILGVNYDWLKRRVKD